MAESRICFRGLRTGRSDRVGGWGKADHGCAAVPSMPQKRSNLALSGLLPSHPSLLPAGIGEASYSELASSEGTRRRSSGKIAAIRSFFVAKG